MLMRDCTAVLPRVELPASSAVAAILLLRLDPINGGRKLRPLSSLLLLLPPSRVSDREGSLSMALGAPSGGLSPNGGMSNALPFVGFFSSSVVFQFPRPMSPGQRTEGASNSILVCG